MVALLAGVALIGPSDFFISDRSTQVEESSIDEQAEVLKRSTFVGTAGHDVTGTVLLVEHNGELYLRFENYSQTPGPDVFVYVTPSETPDSNAEIAADTEVPIDGGSDDGAG